MKIASYEAYFHDGTVIDIQHIENTLLISMESAEISAEDELEKIPLSERRTLKGILHLKKIIDIHLNDKLLSGKLQMLGDSGNIITLEIRNNRVYLDVSWHHFPPKEKTDAFSHIIIDAQEIFWENIPDLYDPFW